MLPVLFDSQVNPYTAIVYVDSRYTKSVSNGMGIEKINLGNPSENVISSSNVSYLHEKIINEFIESYQSWNTELQEEEMMIINSDEISESEKQKAIAEAERRRSNFRDSVVVMQRFIEYYKSMMRADFLPSISIDDDGEISFEWYGRPGARALLTFRSIGTLNFLVLFHEDFTKYQKRFYTDIPLEIQNSLKKIYKDMNK